jgi:hypothetical protein
MKMKQKTPGKQSKFSDLEVFSGSKKISTPNITISKKGVISFNRAFIKAAGFGKEDYAFLIIKYSPSENAIIFNIHDRANDVNSFKINIFSQATISLISFFKYYKIDLEIYSGNYVPIIADDEWAIYLEKQNKES